MARDASGRSWAVIRFENVTKQYAGRPERVLSELDLEIDEGSFCVLLGRSGAGKSTALKLVNRLIEPSNGRVFVDGKPVDGQDPIGLRRSIGYVLQRIGLLPHLTVADNVALVPSLCGWSRGRANDRTAELLRLVGLSPDDFAQRLPAELSGGQQQRVGVARALAANPKVLLMDEPFGALDPVTRGDLRREVARLQRLLHITTVMVTHDVTEALLLADEIVVLDHGLVVQRGTPRELWRNPCSDFVARLLESPREDMAELERVLYGARS
jgi:osmoprotectant transport system ATP-binding protein